MMEIEISPLLTDEDLQLLHSATSGSTHFPDDHLHPPHDSTHFLHDSTQQLSWIKPLSIFIPILIIICWLLHPLTLVVGVALPLLFLFVTHRRSARVISQAQTSRLEYHSAMDNLLTQLTVTIRWLQEVEIVSRGLTRPLTSLPASRLDHGNTNILLRRRVLWTCTNVLGLLRTSTRYLCESSGDMRLPPELGDKRSYLAFTPLSELHQFLREGSPKLAADGDEDNELQALSLESIKVINVPPPRGLIALIDRRIELITLRGPIALENMS